MASTNLSRANGSGSATTKFTYSVWLKYSGWYTGGQRFFSATGGSGDTYFRFNEDGTLEISGDNSAATSLGYFITNRKFRDHSAWMHIVIKVDTTQSTQTDRFKLYINGVDEAGVGGYSTGTYPNQNADDNISLSSNTHYIGGAASSQYFNGLMTHIHYSDGYAYDASTFGETDSTSGIWKPKTSPTGITYGTNGYFLKFENSGAMGTDSSGNGNNFTVSGTLTQNVDTTSNNFATMNPLTKGVSASAYPSFANGNTTITNTVRQHGFSSLGVSSGKWYTEFKITSGATSSVTGISDGSYTTYLGHGTGDYSYRGSDGTWYNNQSATSYGSALSDNDIVGVALDLDNNKLYFSINGTFQNSGDPTSGSSGTGAISISAPATGFYHFATGNILTSGTITAQSNFGQGYFGTTAVASANADANGHGAMEYAVPSGYYTLNTKNIKEFG
jgi:hypothetical protein